MRQSIPRRPRNLSKVGKTAAPRFARSSRLSEIVPYLPHVNASLNALATVLLIVGFMLIKQRQESAHKWTMLACFGVSVLFLASYVTYHLQLKGVSKPFPSYPPSAVRYAYFA